MTPGSDPLAAVAGWPVPTAAVGVTASDATLASTGPLDEPLPLASVTKLLTALAVLVAVRGLRHRGRPRSARDGAHPGGQPRLGGGGDGQ